MTLQVKAIILLVLAALVAVAIGIAYKAGRADGRKLERSEWQGRELKELAAANGMIMSLNLKARATEAAGAARLSEIGGQLEKERRDHAKTKTDRDAARRMALLSGAERVSVAVTGCEDPGRSPGPETASGAGEPAAPRGGRAFLHPQVAADLEQLTRDADDELGEAVRDLNACLAVVAEDRRIVNGP